MGCARLWRGQCGNSRVSSLGDLSHGTGGVVRWDSIDVESEQSALSLRERFWMRSDLADVVYCCSWHTVERVPNFDEVFGKDREPNMAVVTWEAVENRENGASGRILHRQDKSIHRAFLKCRKSKRKSTEPNKVAVREQLRRGLMAIAVGFPLVTNDHWRQANGLCAVSFQLTAQVHGLPVGFAGLRGEFHRWLQQSGIMSGVNAATNRWRCSVWLEGVSQGKNVM